MSVDLVIVNSRIFTDGLIVEGGIAVDEGRIVAIGKELTLPKADKRVDAGGNLVLPGLVDVHVHFRDPGRTHKEDFLTGSMAAAAGGVTTVVDEPNNTPTTTTLRALREKKRIGAAKSIVDHSFSVGLNPRNLDRIPAFMDEGVIAFDVFDEMEGPSLDIPDTGTLHEAMNRVKEAGGLCCLNCREAGLRTSLTKRLRDAGRRGIEAYAESSPPLEEALGAAKHLLLAESVGVKTHLREVSASSTVMVLDRLKPETGFTVEVTPNHLLLSTKDAEMLGPYSQIPPPLRAREDNEALWSALNLGVIDIIASDHAPHTREEKDRGLEDIWGSPPGLPGVETMLPLMLTQVNGGRISLQRVVEATSELPAKIYGLYPGKGAIRLGFDADLVVVDLKREGVIRGDSLHSKIDWTPFEGWGFKGMPVMTFVRGVKVMEEGEVTVQPGHGAFTTARKSDPDQR